MNQRLPDLAGESELRILLTSARDLWDRKRVVNALSDVLALFPTTLPARLIHGDAIGGDAHGADIWRDWVRTWPSLFLSAEKYPASDFPDPKTRNLHMVGLNVHACVAIASRWASGTGHCARAARAKGIWTKDFGVSTRIEDRVDDHHTRWAS